MAFYITRIMADGSKTFQYQLLYSLNDLELFDILFRYTMVDQLLSFVRCCRLLLCKRKLHLNLGGSLMIKHHDNMSVLLRHSYTPLLYIKSRVYRVYMFSYFCSKT